ncbi:MAG TPA: DUF5684 domain-containing protein [Tepidisphaeraceae bacterium]|jgi:hypothetical protein
MSHAGFSLLLAQSSSTSSAAGTVGFLAALLMGIAIWLIVMSLLGGLMFYKVLEKGGQPAWASFVPFYNFALLFKMSGKNPLLALLMVGAFVPIVGGIFVLIGWILMGLAVGKAFGKDGGFIAGLVLLGVVFYPILGFGQSRYLAGAAQPQGFPVMPPQ